MGREHWCIHSIEDPQRLDGLAGLPQSIEWRLFKCRQDGRLFLDHGYDQNSAWDVENFSNAPNFHASPIWQPRSFRFDDDHAYLNRLAEDWGICEQMSRWTIKYAQLVSAAVKGRVFFTDSDSDGHDTVCLAENGRLLGLKFCNGDELMSVNADGQVERGPNPYRSEEEGTISGGLACEESVRRFGYRLPCFEDVAIESPAPPAGEFDLVMQSTLGKRRQYTLFESIWGLLWRGPF